jgi:hypothetical protein
MHRWKLVLAWGCLIMFFGVPLFILSLHLYNLQTPNAFFQHLSEFKYFADYLRTITVIIISLAGLHTVELFKK